MRRTPNEQRVAFPLRVYMVGSHATGKTTLARWVSEQYELPMIAEVARGVLSELEAQLDTLRSDIGLVNRYQARVFARQIEAEQKVEPPFVSDRAFCNLAYAAHHSTIMAEVARDPRLPEYMDWVRSGIVFFLRPHPELVRPDGVRAGLDWEEVVRIDGMVKCMLEMYGVPYIPVESLSMQERVRLVERVLSLAGLRRSRDPATFLGQCPPAGIVVPSTASPESAPTVTADRET